MADFQPNERTQPTTISGMRGHEQLVSARIVVDMADTILLYQPEATPLLTLTAKVRNKRETHNPRFDWLEKDEYPRGLDVVTGADASATTFVLAAGQGARIGANYVLINLRTGENILVVSVNVDTPTVVRGIGGNASDIQVGDKLIYGFQAFEDGAGLGPLRSIQEFAQFGYTQIVRTPFGFTGRDLQVEMYGGRDETVETKWQGIEHKKSIEYLAFFGKRQLLAAGAGSGPGNHQQTFTDGLDNRIATYRWNVAGTPFTERAFIEFLEEGMRWGKGGNQNGSGTKYLFAPSRLLTEINSFAVARVMTRPTEKILGFDLKEYISPHGSVMLVHAPILDYFHKDRAFLVDLNHIRYAYLRGRDTKLLYDRQLPDVDARENEYFTDCGFQVEQEFAHAEIHGF